MSTRFKDREPEPIKEWIVPPYGTSPVTGISGVMNWSGINRPDKNSRWVIGDAEFDDLGNFFPQGVQLQQIPYKGPAIATLAAPVVFAVSLFFAGQVTIFALCTNGHFYQMALNGVITDLRASGGFSTTPPCSIANWQGSVVIISDPNGGKVYSWDGASFLTVFSSQPNTDIHVFDNRLWIASRLTLTWTAIGTYNSLGGDSGNAQIIDDDAQSSVIQLWSFLGSLYLFGSDWIKTVNNLQDVGAPAVLVFGLNSITGQIGVSNRWTVVPYGNIIYYANAYGIWELTGSAPAKVSIPMDGFFQNIDINQSTFAGAYGVVFDTPCLFWHVFYNGDSNVPAGHTIIGLVFVNNQPTAWFRIQQGAMLYIVGTAAAQLTNNLPSVFAVDDHNNVVQLFQDTTTSYPIFANTKIWDINGSKLDYKQFHAAMLALIALGPVTGTIGLVPAAATVGGSAAGAQFSSTPVSIAPPISTGLWVNSVGQTGQWINTALTLGNWAGAASSAYFPLQFNIGWMNRGLGLNINLTGAGIILQSIIVGYSDTEASWGP